MMKRINLLRLFLILLTTVSPVIAQDSGARHRPGANDADNYFERGMEHYRAGDYAKALEDFKRAIGGKPSDPTVYNNLGMVYSHLGWDKDAVEAFQQAIRLKPEWAIPHYN